MRVDLEDYWIMLAFRRCINTSPLEDIEWHEDGEKIEIPQETIDEFLFTGLSNVDFIQSGYYEKQKQSKENNPQQSPDPSNQGKG